MHLNPKLAGTLILLFGLSGPASAIEHKPNYDFEQLDQVRSLRNSQVDGWAPLNDQVLIMTVSPKRKYLVVLTRPDHNLTHSHRIGVISRSGSIMAKFDQVYAMESGIKLGIPIKAIYKLEGKEQEELARKLVAGAETQD